MLKTDQLIRLLQGERGRGVGMVRAPVSLFLDDSATSVRRTVPVEAATPEGGLVDAVRPGSIAATAGIRPGARVLAANGRELRDVVDFQFYTAEPEVELRLREPEGDERTYHIEKWPDDDIGLEFAAATWDGVRVCSNTCFFCFLKGNPKGLRRTLYVKDDDYRLSFLHGNFVTLTNLTPADWARLREQRLSPLNVSVHATEPELRRRMLGYPDAPDIVGQLRLLGKLRIQTHTQIVLCPGVNDGAALDRTIADLGALYPAVQTISIVPVGATMQFEQRMGMVHRPIDETRACSPEYARALVRQVRGWQRRFMEEHGAAIVQPADEYLLTAGARVPAARWYDDFPQYENGIGMTRLLLDDWRRARQRQRAREQGARSGERDGSVARGLFEAACPAGPALRTPHSAFTIACGVLIAPLLSGLVAELAELTSIDMRVEAIRNEHFGPRINVSGLLTASDFVTTLRERELGDLVVLPRASLDYFGRRFLDDGTPADLERELNRPVRFASSMSDIVDLLQNPASSVTEPGRAETTNGWFWGSR